MEGYSKMENINVPCQDEESDSEFMEFLMKTKESLAKLDLKSDNESESDVSFGQFVSQQKQDSPPHLKNEDDQVQDGASDSEFMEFLMKTKENLAKVDIESDKEVQDDESDVKFKEFLAKTKERFSKSNADSDEEGDSDVLFEQFVSQQKQNSPLHSKNGIQSSEDESDAVFEQFISQQKQDSTVHFKKTKESFSVPHSTSLRSKRSHRLYNENDKENNCLVSTEKNKSASMDASFNIYDLETKTNFRSKRDIYAKQLFHYFNRKVFNNQLPSDTPIEWSELLRRTAGKAHCKWKANVYACSIELSSKVLTSFDRLRDTLLHEMCHAAVWIVNNSRCNHGPLWQTWALRCKIALPQIDLPKRCHSYEIDYKFMYKCSKCHYKIGRHSKSIKIDKVVCPYCFAKLVLHKS